MQLLVLDSAGKQVGLVDDHEEVEVHYRAFQPSTLKVRINRFSQSAADLKVDRFVIALDEEEPVVFLLDQREQELDEVGSTTDIVTVLGHEVGLFKERIVIPPTGESHDVQDNVPAETAMKHYVDASVGANAAAARQLPRFRVAADQARGVSVNSRARFARLDSLLERLGLMSGVGWRVTYDRAANEYEFETIVGADRSSEVIFSLDMDSIRSQRRLQSKQNVKTFAYVAGQGEGVDRQVITHYLDAAEPEGFGRREAFVDARDVDNEEAGSAETLEQRAKELLEASRSEDILEVNVNTVGSFRYREHWFLCDIVRVRSGTDDLDKTMRIVGLVRTSTSDGEELVAELDRSWPTLKDRVQQAASSGGGATSEGTVDYPGGGGGGGAPDPHGDGSHSEDYSKTGHSHPHNHDGDYAGSTHDHPHNHDGDYAAAGHGHVHNHDGDYASGDHDHGTEFATAETIVKRDFTGRAEIQDPYDDLEIANKRYVDDAVAGASGGDSGPLMGNGNAKVFKDLAVGHFSSGGPFTIRTAFQIDPGAMFLLKGQLYDYGGSGTFDFTVSAYAYSGGFANVGGNARGSIDFEVRLYSDNSGNLAVQIGRDGINWNFCTGSVDLFMTGYNDVPDSEAEGWFTEVGSDRSFWANQTVAIPGSI